MAELSGRIDAEPDSGRYPLARKLWNDTSVRAAVHGPVRDELCKMAPGLERCMYCGDNQGTDVPRMVVGSRIRLPGENGADGSIVRGQPFADVCQAMLRQAVSPGGAVVFEEDPGLVELLSSEPIRAAFLV